VTLDVIVFDEHGKPTIVQKPGECLNITKTVVVDFTEALPLGRCICCGHTEYLSVLGNILLITCDIGPNGTNTTQCERNIADKCHGIGKCSHEERFDPGRETNIITIVKETLGKMFEVTKCVLVYDGHPYLRKVVAGYMVDRRYDVGGYIIGDTQFFIIQDREFKRRKAPPVKNESADVANGDYYLT